VAVPVSRPSVAAAASWVRCSHLLPPHGRRLPAPDSTEVDRTMKVGASKRGFASTSPKPNGPTKSGVAQCLGWAAPPAQLYMTKPLLCRPHLTTRKLWSIERAATLRPGLWPGRRALRPSRVGRHHPGAERMPHEYRSVPRPDSPERHAWTTAEPAADCERGRPR